MQALRLPSGITRHVTRQQPPCAAPHALPSIHGVLRPALRCTQHRLGRGFEPCSPAGRRPVTAAAMTVESIVDPFLWANSSVTYAWLLLIIAPRWELTKTIFKSDLIVIIPSLAFLYFFVAATAIDNTSQAELTEKSVYLFTEAVTDPRKMMTLMTPAYVAQDWVHLLAWDFIVGRFVWLEALEKNLPMRHSLLATFMFGPVGLLVHLITKYVVGAWRQQQQPAASSSGPDSLQG